MMTIVIFGGFVAVALLVGALRHAFQLTDPAVLALVLTDLDEPIRRAERLEVAAGAGLRTGSITEADYRGTLEALAAAEPQPRELGRLTR